MRIQKSIFSKLCIGLFISASCYSHAFAAEVVLYEQPAANAKQVGKVDLSTGVIPIYTPEKSDWIKVADPRNGNVGWVKSSDVSSTNHGGIVFTQKIINNGQGAKTYQFMEYANPMGRIQFKKPSPEAIKKWEARQRLMQQEMNHSMHEMMRNMNNLYRQQWEILNSSGFPMVEPIVVIPAPTTQPAPRSPYPTQGKEAKAPRSGEPAQSPTSVQQTEEPTSGREATAPRSGQESTGPQSGGQSETPVGR